MRACCICRDYLLCLATLMLILYIHVYIYIMTPVNSTILHALVVEDASFLGRFWMQEVDERASACRFVVRACMRLSGLSETIVRSRWGGDAKTASNSRTTYSTVTRLAGSTFVNTAVKKLESRGCKPPVTKLASLLHTRLRVPQLCSPCSKECRRDCHMTSWRK